VSYSICKPNVYTQKAVAQHEWKKGRNSWKGHDTFIPIIATRKNVADLFDQLPTDATEEFPEKAQLDSLVRYQTAEARVANANLYIKFLGEKAAQMKAGSGRLSFTEQDVLDSVIEDMEKLKAHETALTDLVGRLRGLTPDSDGWVAYSRTYSSNSTRRERRHVTDRGAQELSRRVRPIVFPGMIDADIKSCLFTIVVQVVDRAGILLSGLVAKFTTVRELNDRREEILLAIDPDRAEAKRICIATFSGQRIPLHLVGNDILKGLQQEGRLFRWLAISLRPNLHDDFIEDSTRPWPDATSMHNLWTQIEDWILEAWCQYVKTSPITHLSLHYDGILVDKHRIEASANFIAEAQQAIHDATNYKVEIEYKEQLSLFQTTARGATSGPETKTLGKLSNDGNCILLCLAILLDRVADIKKEVGKNNAVNADAEKRNWRTYRECAELLKVVLTPTSDGTLSEGKFLLHAEANGTPHCIGIDVDSNGACQIYDGSCVWISDTDTTLGDSLNAFIGSIKILNKYCL
jgi:hypothetical protein